MLSFNLEDSVNPATIKAAIMYHCNDVNILTERISTRAISAPAATEWREIFHLKLINVTTIARHAVEKIYDFKNAGIGNLNMMYEVVPYKTVVSIRGIFLSFRSLIL